MKSEHDVVIIGGGPAGLQLAYCLEQQGRDYVLLERADKAGSFYETLPRRRLLISINKVYTGYDDPERNMRWDWNSLLTDDHSHLMKDYSKEYLPNPDRLVEYLGDFAEKYLSKVQYGCDVTSIDKTADGEDFNVSVADGRVFSSNIVVVATGFSRPWIPRVPGIDFAEQYSTFDNDPEGFANKRVLMIGKGNSSFETASELLHVASLIHVVSPHSIKFAWNTHHAGHLRAVNNHMLDSYQLKVQNAVLDARVTRIRKTEEGQLAVSLEYSHARGEIEEIIYDRVICCTGFRMDGSIFGDGVRPARSHEDRFPELTPEFESVNVPRLFFAGTLTQSLDFKKTNSAFIHGFRYNAKALADVLGVRFFSRPLPRETFEFNVRGLTERMLDRINTSSSIWQQFGFFGDAAVVDGDQVHYYSDLPVAYLHGSEIGNADQYYVLTLEFGPHQGDVFAIERNPDIGAAEQSFFLHPVVRFFSKGVLVRTHHLLENLFAEWEHRHLHVRPLLEFIGVNSYPPDALLRAVEGSQSERSSE